MAALPVHVERIRQLGIPTVNLPVYIREKIAEFNQLNSKLIDLSDEIKTDIGKWYHTSCKPSKIPIKNA